MDANWHAILLPVALGECHVSPCSGPAFAEGAWAKNKDDELHILQQQIICLTKTYHGVTFIQQWEVGQIESLRVWSKKEKEVLDNKVSDTECAEAQ